MGDTKPEELFSLGIPLRFAKELTLAAQDAASDHPGERPQKGKEKGKGKGKEKGKDNGKDVGKSRGKDKGRGKDSHGRQEFQQTLDMEELDPSFEVKPKLIGFKGSNVHHIQDTTGAQLWVTGDHGSAIHVEVVAQSSKELDRAVKMVEDLI